MTTPYAYAFNDPIRAEGGAQVVVDYLLDAAVDYILPGPTPKVAKRYREAINEAKDVTKKAIEAEKTYGEKKTD